MRKNEFKFTGPQNLSLLVMFNRFGDVSINPLGVGFQPRRESFTLEVFCLKHLNDVVEKLARVSLKTPTIDTQKDVGGCESNSFISVDEWMIDG